VGDACDTRGRFATPADFPLHDCGPYRGLHVRRESLGFLPRSRGHFLSPSKPLRQIRNFCIAELQRGWSARPAYYSDLERAELKRQLLRCSGVLVRVKLGAGEILLPPAFPYRVT
jgi:hypothetical protein